jgi:CheY-like chemotaxis protein/anti-sigma regulatory factor (Ser/Thr protein kinase)
VTPSDRTTPQRVLIADDDPDQRLVLRTLLRRSGIDQVVEAADGVQVLEAAGRERFDLIVLDLAMPERSGFEVLPELHAEAAGTPIVVLSNFQRSRLGEVVMGRGAVGYVEKRVPPDRLVQEILLAAAVTSRASAVMSASFPSDISAAADARSFVTDALRAHDSELLASVELLVSELVTNAVVHASSAPRVDVQLTEDTARVEVFDDDPALPEAQLAPPGSRGGRGLFLVDRLASRWGATPHPDGGKVVWFEIDRGRAR